MTVINIKGLAKFVGTYNLVSTDKKQKQNTVLYETKYRLLKKINVF